MSDFIASLPEQYGPERERLLLARFRARQFDDIDWCEVVAEIPGHRARFWVSADAVKIDGVRINVSATLAQLASDATGFLLPTAHVLDLRHAQADVVVTPCMREVLTLEEQHAMTSTAWMVEHSRAIDVKLDEHGAVTLAGGASAPLVSTVGKVWLSLDNDLRSEALFVSAGWPDVGLNYGWHDPHAPNGRGIWQDRGHRHNRWHADYSQTLLFMLPTLVLDDEGEPREVLDVAQDPALAPLVTGKQGVLRVLRHPRVALNDEDALAPPGHR